MEFRQILYTMSAVTCSLSGEVCDEPVVSKKSGHVFEKRVITKFIETSGKCPVTEEPLGADDLLDLQVTNKAVKPRPASATSIPSLLQLFQNEWDALMLESYKLKQHVEAVRQELSHALYQHDAAYRVIARLTQERDKALAELADTRKNMATALASSRATQQQQGDAMDVDPAAQGITEAMVKRINELSERLSKARKKRFKRGRSQPLQSKDTLEAYEQTQSLTLHSPSDPGILCMSVNPQDERVIVTGGADSTVLLMNTETKKQVCAPLKSHKKKVLSVKHHPTSSIILSGSADKTVKIWTVQDDKWVVGRSLTTHKGSVTGISIHPLQDYFLTCGDDGAWCFHDMQGRTYMQVDAPKNLPLTCLQWHPDGVIIATGGQDDRVRIWDVKSRTKEIAATFEGHKGGISAIEFSENGYYLATSDNNGVVKLWDLRKLKNFEELTVGSKAVKGLKFDQSGHYLAAGGGQGIVKIYETKKWTEIKTFSNHSKNVTGLEWSSQADFLASVSKDRTLKIYGN